MNKIKDKIMDMQLHYLENKKRWIIGIILVLCLILIALLVTFTNKRNKPVYNDEGIEVCAKGDTYNISTGEPCKGVKIEKPTECAEGDKFSIVTGEPCPEISENNKVVENKVELAETAIEAPKVVETPTKEPAPPETMVKNTSLPPLSPDSAYAKALVEYSGKVLSFDDSCNSTPKELSVPANTLVMMANESSKSHTLALGGKSTPLDPRHYDLMFVGANGPYTATCDGANSANVIIK